LAATQVQKSNKTADSEIPLHSMIYNPITQEFNFEPIISQQSNAVEQNSAALSSSMPLELMTLCQYDNSNAGPMETVVMNLEIGQNNILPLQNVVDSLNDETAFNISMESSGHAADSIAPNALSMRMDENLLVATSLDSNKFINSSNNTFSSFDNSSNNAVSSFDNSSNNTVSSFECLNPHQNTDPSWDSMQSFSTSSQTSYARQCESRSQLETSDDEFSNVAECNSSVATSKNERCSQYCFTQPVDYEHFQAILNFENLQYQNPIVVLNAFNTVSILKTDTDSSVQKPLKTKLQL